jgi:hypothetical protein
MTAGRSINTNSQDWCTPQKYVEAVRDFFGTIELDPCSNRNSIVGAKVEYVLPKTDGLKASWEFSTIFINPPYGIDKLRGTSIKNWIQKCLLTHKNYGSEILALIPVAVNTRHWKEYIFAQANSICFLADTRLKFMSGNGMSDKGAPMACCIVYWGKKTDEFYNNFSKYGAVVDINSLKQKKWVSPDIKQISLL